MRVYAKKKGLNRCSTYNKYKRIISSLLTPYMKENIGQVFYNLLLECPGKP